MSNLYCSSTAYAAVTPWAASTAYTVGQIVRQLATPAVNNERCFRVMTAGTSGATEPTWGLGKGATTTDSTVVWMEITGLEAYQAPGNWAAPFARMSPLCDRMAAGDTGVFSSDHAEVSTSGATINVVGTNNTLTTFISVNRAAGSHVPPQAGDYIPGALITMTGGNYNLGNQTTISQFYGISITLNGATESNQLQFLGGSNAGEMYFYDCTLRMNGNGGLFTSNSNNYLAFQNVTFLYNNTGQRMALNSARYRFCKFAPTGVVPSVLVGNFFLVSALAEFEGCDFSTFGPSNAIIVPTGCVARVIIKDCKLGSAAIQSGNTFPVDIYVVRCSDASGNITDRKYNGWGQHLQDNTVVRTGGASDGTTARSWLVSTTAYCAWGRPFNTAPISIWNATVGSSLTVTAEGIWNSAALPNSDEVWLESEFLGTVGSALGSTVSGTKATFFSAGTPAPASTAAWDGAASARANGQSYAIGAVIKVASNPGRVFFCTSGGTSAASEPAGYASAVDGGTVTDGGATFRAGVRFKLQTTITPALAGPITIYPKVAKTSASALYLDPLATAA